MSASNRWAWKRVKCGMYARGYDSDETLMALVYRSLRDNGGGVWAWDLYEYHGGQWVKINQQFFKEGTLWQAKDEASKKAGEYVKMREGERASTMVKEALGILGDVVGKKHHTDTWTDDDWKAHMAKIADRYGRPTSIRGGCDGHET